jgi:hypothetical protein
MAVLGRYLARAAQDRESVTEAGWQGKVTGVLSGKGSGDAAARKSMSALGARLAEATASSTDELIRLHGLSGKAARQVLDRVSDDYAHNARTPEGAAAALGGLVSGAVGGLAADLATGGLTLGGGMVVGASLGVLGATGVAKSVNMGRGDDGPSMRWSAEFGERLAVTALMRYLAVAHFGRGRGEWAEGEHPAFWQPIVEQAMATSARDLARIHKDAAGGADVAAPMADLMRRCGAAILSKLYPEAPVAAELAPAPAPAALPLGDGTAQDWSVGPSLR